MKLQKLFYAILVLMASLSIANAQCSSGFSYTSGSFSVGDTISFTNTSTYNSPVDFYWTFGDGTTSYMKDPIKIYSQGGAYSVCLVISDSARNCMSSYCDSILVTGSSATCKASFNFSVGIGSNDKTVSFSNSSTYSGSSASYSWSFGDGNSSASTAPAHTYNSYGNYQVTLEVTSGTCTDKVTKLVQLKNASSTCQSNFAYSFDSSNSCTIHLTNKSIGGLSSYWSFGDGSVSTKWSPRHAYTRDGYYSVSLTVFDSSSSCSDTYIDSIYVRGCNSSSGCIISAIRSYKDSIDTCKTIFIASVNSSSMANISWNFGDGNYGNGNPSTHKYAAKGWYVVTATYSDSANNCSATYSDSVWGYGCGNTNCNFTLNGQVFVGRNLAQSASVFLIEKNGNILTAVDSVGVDSMGYYAFVNVCKGDYYIKTALLSSDANYYDYLPTYYSNVMRWDSAQTVSISKTTNGLDISMVPGFNLGGKGFIGGDVRKGANKRNGEPLGQVQVVILNENLEASAYTYSNKEGRFELPNLELGNYYLFVDIPGLTSNGTWIELSEEEPEVADVYIEVNTDEVSTSVKQPIDSEIEGISLFPNPANDYIRIDGLENVALLRIYDISGKILLTVDSSQFSPLGFDISSLGKGVYLIEIQGSKAWVFSEWLIVK